MNSDSSGENRYEMMAEINMIPLIDVALVLLIIFMIMTPYLVRSQLKVQLPRASEAEAVKETQPIEIQVTKAGQVLMGGQTVAPDQVGERLRALAANPAEQTVMIQADRDVVFERVVEVLSRVRQAGSYRVGVGVMHEKGGGVPVRAGRSP